MKIRIKKLRETATLPTQGSAQAAGYDLYADIPEGELVINPGQIQKVSTGICAAPEENDVALCLFPRSGLATKQGVTLINSIGLVDSDYRGEIIVPLVNHGQFPVHIKDGDRIAQLVVIEITRADFEEVAELSGTSRGEGGFGSTGV
jgi:dUTP pyrophosphatase